MLQARDSGSIHLVTLVQKIDELLAGLQRLGCGGFRCQQPCSTTTETGARSRRSFPRGVSAGIMRYS